MAVFNANEADNYGSQGGSGFFSLRNDKDVAAVRFLYNGIDDVKGMSVHRVAVGTDSKGKPINRYVDCLRSYSEPIDKCPFCREGYKTEAKLFIPIYNETEKQLQIWDRGKKMFQKISSICSRYPNLVSHKFEIERNGAAGEQTTTYEIYEVGQDDTRLEDFESIPDTSSLVLEKTAEDMEFYIESKQFPPTGEEGNVRSRERRETNDNVNRRRTPATNNRRGDAF